MSNAIRAAGTLAVALLALSSPAAGQSRGSGGYASAYAEEQPEAPPEPRDQQKGTNQLSLCLGKAIAVCLTPLDPERIRTSAGRWLGTTLSVPMSTVWGKTRPKLLLVRPEIGNQWSFKRGIGEAYGSLFGVIAFDRLLFAAVFATGDRYQQLTTSQVRDLSPVGTTYLGGEAKLFALPIARAKLGGADLTRTGRAQSSFVGLGLSASFQRIVLPDAVYTLSRGDFNREVQIRLIEQRPITQADIEERLLGIAPSLYSVLDLGGVIFETAGDIEYHNGGGLRAATIRAAQDIRLGVARPYFEVGLAARGQVTLLRNSPVMFLPSIGGHFAMRSVPDGELTNQRSGAVALFAGPGVLRLFAERGWSGDSYETNGLWGGGLAIAPFRVFDFLDLLETDAVDQVPFQSLIRLLQAADLTVVVGGNEKNGFVFTATGGIMTKL